MADNESFNLAYTGLNQREQNLFREEYYSGTDTKIYFDDVDQKEISHIAFTIQEQLLPIFGYASRTFDTVAVGNRVVNGTLTMPIRNPEHIATVDEVIKSSKTNFEKNDEYNNLEMNKLKENDWVDESTGSGKTDGTTDDTKSSDSKGSNKEKKDGAGHIYDGTAADDAWHEGQEYQKWLDEQKKKEKKKDDGYISTDDITDEEYKTIVKNHGYSSIASFQKDHNLESNGILDQNTKDQIILEYYQPTYLEDGGILRSGPSDDSANLDVLYPRNTAGKSKIWVINVVENSNNEWWYVITENGTRGYVHEKNLGMG